MFFFFFLDGCAQLSEAYENQAANTTTLLNFHFLHHPMSEEMPRPKFGTTGSCFRIRLIGEEHQNLDRNHDIFCSSRRGIDPIAEPARSPQRSGGGLHLSNISPLSCLLVHISKK